MGFTFVNDKRKQNCHDQLKLSYKACQKKHLPSTAATEMKLVVLPSKSDQYRKNILRLFRIGVV